jgi:hypothetical protein
MKLLEILKQFLKEETTRERILKKDLEISQIEDLRDKALSFFGKKYGWNENKLNEFLTKYDLFKSPNNEKYDKYSSFIPYIDYIAFKKFAPELYQECKKVIKLYNKKIYDIYVKYEKKDDMFYRFGDINAKYVYHYTTLSNTKQILKSNSIKGNAKSYYNSWISVTTDKDLLQNFKVSFSGDMDLERSNPTLLACFVIDFNKIKQDNFKIKVNPPGAEEGEQEIEILEKNIEPLSKYVNALILNGKGKEIENVKKLAVERNIKVFSGDRPIKTE